MSKHKNSVPDNSLNETPRKFGSLTKHNYSYTKPSILKKDRDIHIIPENDDAAGVMASGA